LSCLGDCKFTVRGSGGIIKTPNYPNNYSINKICTWTIKVGTNEEVELEFQRVDLEGDSSCRYDYIEVRDGDNEYAAIKEKFCGNTVPEVIKSSGDALYVEFFSDESDTKTGFYASWKAIDAAGRFETTQSTLVTTSTPTEKQGNISSDKAGDW